jgi:spore morphogenesis protein SipL
MYNRCIDYDDIEIRGLCNPELIDFELEKYPYWTQISIPESLLVPTEKPDIEEINSINIDVQIIRKKVIVTPRSGGVDSSPPAENNEGKELTGRKLIIEGLLCQTVTYTAAEEDQSVHSIQFAVPFSAFIVIPRRINGVDTKNITFDINKCIEDVYIKDFCPRQIFKNVTLLLQAVPVPSEECLEEWR